MVWTLFSLLCMLKSAWLWPIKGRSCARSVHIPQLRFGVHSHEVKDNPFSPTAPCRLFDSPLPVGFGWLSFQSVRQTQFRDCWTKSKPFTYMCDVWRATDGNRDYQKVSICSLSQMKSTCCYICFMLPDQQTSCRDIFAKYKWQPCFLSSPWFLVKAVSRPPSSKGSRKETNSLWCHVIIFVLLHSASMES